MLSIPAALAAYFLAEKLSAYVYIAAFFVAAALAGFSDWVRAERARAAGTSAFGWYAAMVLISAGVFATIVGFVDTLDRPKVQSAAVLRKGEDRAIPGLYVAETADRIYLGEAVVEEQDRLRAKCPMAASSSSHATSSSASEWEHPPVSRRRSKAPRP